MPPPFANPPQRRARSLADLASLVLVGGVVGAAADRVGQLFERLHLLVARVVARVHFGIDLDLGVRRDEFVRDVAALDDLDAGLRLRRDLVPDLDYLV